MCIYIYIYIYIYIERDVCISYIRLVRESWNCLGSPAGAPTAPAGLKRSWIHWPLNGPSHSNTNNHSNTRS